MLILWLLLGFFTGFMLLFIISACIVSGRATNMENEKLR